MVVSGISLNLPDGMRVRIGMSLSPVTVSTVVEQYILATPNAVTEWGSTYEPPDKRAYESIEGETFTFDRFATGLHYIPAIDVKYKRVGLVFRINGSGLPLPDSWQWGPQITTKSYWVSEAIGDSLNPLVEYDVRYLRSRLSKQFLVYYRVKALKIIAGYHMSRQSIYVPNTPSHPARLLIDGYNALSKMFLTGVGYERSINNKITFSFEVLSSPEINVKEYYNADSRRCSNLMFHTEGHFRVDYLVRQKVGVSIGLNSITTKGGCEALTERGLVLGLFGSW